MDGSAPLVAPIPAYEECAGYAALMGYPVRTVKLTPPPELKMDVAGGGAREGSLAFLPLREAQALRATLMQRRDAVRAGSAPGVCAQARARR